MFFPEKIPNFSSRDLNPLEQQDRTFGHTLTLRLVSNVESFCNGDSKNLSKNTRSRGIQFQHEGNANIVS